MSKLEYPDRIFSLSDCHGGHGDWNPLEAPDVAALLAESIRSDLPGIQRIDTFGATEGYGQHIVGEALRLQRENPGSGRTGLFINSAARTKEGENGQPFYRAEFEEGLVVVATPLSVLAGVRDAVKKLLELPNEGNGLYDGQREQHRSSFTPRLLAENHGLNLKEVDPASIPKLPAGGRVIYVDRFGNLVLTDTGETGAYSFSERITKNIGETIKLGVRKTLDPTSRDLISHDVIIGKSLAKAAPGTLVAYGNDGNIEVVAKWDKRWTTQERLERSAYKQFGEPEIGTLAVGVPDFSKSVTFGYQFC